MKRVKFLILLSSLLGLSHCTQYGNRVPLEGETGNNLGNITYVKSVTYGGFQTEVMSMKLVNNYLLLVGKPFGFMIMDVGDPLNPIKIYAAKENIQAFTQNFLFGAWLPDYYGAGGVEMSGTNILMSGSYGASLISAASLSAPFEKNRLPPNLSGNVPPDPKFVYKAIVPHPQNSNTFVGVSLQDGFYFVNTTNPMNVPTPTYQPFSSQGPVCCTKAATIFGNSLLVARTHSLAKYTFNGSGTLNYAGADATTSATYVTKTSKYLYVQSQNSSQKADGIYVYDMSGNLVNFYPLVTLSFVVSSDDRYIIANTDNQKLRVYQIY